MNYRHYFIALPAKNESIGAIIGQSAPAVDSVTIENDPINLEVDETEQLVINIQPAHAGNKNVTYSSDDTAVATVSATGLVTAIGTGTATITVTTIDGNKTDTITVTVA